MIHDSSWGCVGHGGKRERAGRPKGQGRYGEDTACSHSAITYCRSEKFLNQEGLEQHIPLYASRVRAGFPSPADDYVETYLDLNGI